VYTVDRTVQHSSSVQTGAVHTTHSTGILAPKSSSPTTKMLRFVEVIVCLTAYLPSGQLQIQEEKLFSTELFLGRDTVDSGLYDGQVKGRPRFEETQVPHGLGTIYYFTNDRLNRHNYTGAWVNGQREGQGTTTFKDGAVFTGQYKQSLENGPGIIIYPNGNRLEAEFTQGKIEGHGVFRYINGDQREGFFSGNVLEGQVIFTRNDGVTVIEKWENGTRLASEDQIIPNDVDLTQPSPKTSPDQPQQIGTNASAPTDNTHVAINLAALMKAFRSGDRFALIKEREPKKTDAEDFSLFSKKSRMSNSAFLRKIFDSVNPAKR